jgi:tetratricopeptide (TPR) repeat protein
LPARFHPWEAKVVPALRKILATAGFVPALLAPIHAEALTGEQQFERRLLAMLPQYCKYTQIFRERVPGGNNPAEIERWTSIIGPAFIHMHHYCLGLMNTYRAAILAKNRQDRTHNLGNSVLEFNYVIRNTPPDFSMLPEIMTRKGESLILLDRGAEGVVELQGAIERDPGYWPPYAAMSDYYRDLGQLAKARQWAQKGLSVAPNSRALTRRLEALGGTAGKSKSTAGAARGSATSRSSE